MSLTQKGSNHFESDQAIFELSHVISCWLCPRSFKQTINTIKFLISFPVTYNLALQVYPEIFFLSQSFRLCHCFVTFPRPIFYTWRLHRPWSWRLPILAKSGPRWHPVTVNCSSQGWAAQPFGIFAPLPDRPLKKIVFKFYPLLHSNTIPRQDNDCKLLKGGLKHLILS
jgi:hypothetical protein